MPAAFDTQAEAHAVMAMPFGVALLPLPVSSGTWSKKDAYHLLGLGAGGEAVVSLSQEIREAILVLVESATGVDSDTAHSRPRRPVGDATANTRAALFHSSGIVNTWEVAEIDATSEWQAVDVAWTWSTRFAVRGWYEHDDANNSEDAFRTIVQAVTRAINADVTLGGTVTRHETVQVARWDMEAKAGAVCHVVELELVAEWTENP